MKDSVINLITEEYFIYINLEDKSGDCHWNEKEVIRYDIDVEDLHKNFKEFVEVLEI
jgi:hypothetical protein